MSWVAGNRVGKSPVLALGCHPHLPSPTPDLRELGLCLGSFALSSMMSSVDLKIQGFWGSTVCQALCPVLKELGAWSSVRFHISINIFIIIAACHLLNTCHMSDTALWACRLYSLNPPYSSMRWVLLWAPFYRVGVKAQRGWQTCLMSPSLWEVG